MATDNARLYGRRCRVTIYYPARASAQSVQALEVNGGTNPRVPGLRVQFKIEKHREKEPNKSEIVITNLALSTRSSLQVKGLKVVVDAGYEATGVTRIFRGDARSVDHVRNGSDWDTTIKCGDGERAYRHTVATQSFAAGTRAGDVLLYLARNSGLAMGNVEEVAALLPRTFAHGYVVRGPVATSINRLVKSIGYTWSIQDDSIQVLAPGQTRSSLVPEISPATGLIGSPEMGSPEKKHGTALVKIKSLLVPVIPGRAVKLVSERYNGFVTVKKCDHNGDTHGGDWYTTIEGLIQHG